MNNENWQNDGCARVQLERVPSGRTHINVINHKYIRIEDIAILIENAEHLPNLHLDN